MSYCEACHRQSVSIYCENDKAKLCLVCDEALHRHNEVSRRHNRIWLCDLCTADPAVIRCDSDSANLCQSCDTNIHLFNAVASGHVRRPMSSKVILYEAYSASSTAAVPFDQNKKTEYQKFCNSGVPTIQPQNPEEEIADSYSSSGLDAVPHSRPPQASENFSTSFANNQASSFIPQVSTSVAPASQPRFSCTFDTNFSGVTLQMVPTSMPAVVSAGQNLASNPTANLGNSISSIPPITLQPTLLPGPAVSPSGLPHVVSGLSLGSELILQSNDSDPPSSTIGEPLRDPAGPTSIGKMLAMISDGVGSDLSGSSDWECPTSKVMLTPEEIRASTQVLLEVASVMKNIEPETFFRKQASMHNPRAASTGGGGGFESRAGGEQVYQCQVMGPQTSQVDMTTTTAEMPINLTLPINIEDPNTNSAADTPQQRQQQQQPSHFSIPAKLSINGGGGGGPGKKGQCVEEGGFVVPSQIIRVGEALTLTREERVKRFLEKKKQRTFERTIRYASRSAYAGNRPRVKGRFAKKEDTPADNEQSDPTSLGKRPRSGDDNLCTIMDMICPLDLDNMPNNMRVVDSIP